jgi:hypothetical protein
VFGDVRFLLRTFERFARGRSQRGVPARHRSFLLGAGLALAVAVTRPAAAEDPAPPRPLVVVTVAQDATELDAAAVRAAVGQELGADAVGPDDPRAPRATGSIDVSVDRAAHQLVVSYKGRAEPITRRIDLPDDPASIERDAVLLAGNLARDEAGDLVAQLRQRPSPEAAAPPRASEEARKEKEDKDEQEDARELDRLGQTLEADVRATHGPREWIAWTAFGLGMGAVGAGVAIGLVGHGGDAATYFILGGNVSLIAYPVLLGGNFDNLLTYYASERTRLPPALAREDVEQAWARTARSEHRLRRLLGSLYTGLGSLVLAGAVAEFVVARHQASASDVGPWAGFAVIGAANTTLGVYELVTVGPLESALRAYQASSGRPLGQGAGLDLAPHVGAVPGGGFLSLGGRF